MILIKEKKILFINVERQELYKQMDFYELPHYLADKTTVRNLLKQDIDELTREKDKLEQEYQICLNTESTEFWLRDINEFITEYRKHYNE
jgi:hypothetical protein